MLTEEKSADKATQYKLTPVRERKIFQKLRKKQPLPYFFQIDFTPALIAEVKR